MNRTVSTCPAAGLATLIAFLVGSSVPAASPKPNIILAMADDMGWGDPAYNGNAVIRTPNLDAMSKAGLKFNRFYAPTVCSPTRAGYLTGRHPRRLGIPNANTGHLPSQELTVAEALKTKGYATGHFGKWHVGTLTRSERDSNRGGADALAHYAPPWENGFEVTFSTEARVPTWDPMRRPKGKLGAFWNAMSADSESQAFGTAYWSNGRRVTEDLDGDDSKLIMDRALKFIAESKDRQQPFLAVIWFHAPHLPVVAGPRYTALYPGKTDYEKNYFGCITALDEQMGRLRAELRRLDVADDTMLWFCSDNGPEGQAGKDPGSAGPFRGRKRDLWEGGIRVPGLLEWPAAISTPRVVDTPCGVTDVLPTLIDYLGITARGPRPLDGISLRPLISDTSSERSRPIGFESDDAAAWLDGRYKLHAQYHVASAKTKAVATSPREPEITLYDVVADPGEVNNLAVEQPERAKSMRDALEAWRQSCRESNAGADYAASL